MLDKPDEESKLPPRYAMYCTEKGEESSLLCISHAPQESLPNTVVDVSVRFSSIVPVWLLGVERGSTHLSNMLSDAMHVLARLDLAHHPWMVRLGPLGHNHGSSDEALERQ